MTFVVFGVFLLFMGGINSAVLKGLNSSSVIQDYADIPKGPTFTSLECFYCGQASKYIAGLAQAFPTFTYQNQNFQNYLDTVSSLVCDLYGQDDPGHCDIITRYVALYTYDNYIGESNSALKMAKTVIDWANNFFFPIYEGNEGMEFLCEPLDAFTLMLSVCREGIVASVTCPAEMISCKICSHYFWCNENIYC